MFKALFNALLRGQQKRQRSVFISKHLAKITLNELEDEDTLLPDLQSKIKTLKKIMAKKKMSVIVFETLRSSKKQNDFYAKGRSKPGKKITNARGGQSYHQYGLAVDIIFDKYRWNPPKGWHVILGEEGEKLGLEWGGRWKSKDYWHFQLRPEDVEWKELKDYFNI